MKAILSIITVVLNDAEGLLVTADSVIKQTSKNFEWVVVDGGSSDDALAGVSQLESISPVIHSGKDSGIYDAMNKGIELSAGQFLIFMNAGDTFSDDMAISDIEHFIKCNSSVEVILGGTYQKINKCIFYRPPKNIRWIVNGLPAFHQSTIYKAGLMRKIPYNLNFGLLADYEWLAERCVGGVNIGYINRPVSIYSVGGASYTNLKLKFMDSYMVKRHVLSRSKAWSGFSSLLTILKTVFVMSVLYQVCAYLRRDKCADVGNAEGSSLEYYEYKSR